MTTCYVSATDHEQHFANSPVLVKGNVTTAALQPQPIDHALIERVLLHGDLRQLSPSQKVSYYQAVCESVGLNPLTQPFQYLVLNGKEILYARRDATEQLRQIHSVSIKIVAREVVEDCYVVTSSATLPSGRQDESIGAVPIANVKGEARANAMMKAETKSKRRVTLAICGLGMLDETEVASIQPSGYVVEPMEAPALPEKREKLSEPNSGVIGHSYPKGDVTGHAVPPIREASETEHEVKPLGHPPSDNGPDLAADLPPGALLVTKVEGGIAGSKGRIHFNAPLESGKNDALTWSEQAVALASEFCQNATPCFVEMKRSQTGNYRIERLVRVPAGPYDADPQGLGAVDAGDQPF